MEEIEKKRIRSEAFKLFWISASIGAQMFGNSMTVIPILRKEFIEKRKWITDVQLLDIISIARCAPGAYTVNIIAFIGNQRAGWLGGAAASIGISVVPTASILLFTMLYKNISDIGTIKIALTGISVCVCAFIIDFLLDFWKVAITGITTCLIFIFSFLLYALTDTPILIILLGMVILNFAIEKYVLLGQKKKDIH